MKLNSAAIFGTLILSNALCPSSGHCGSAKEVFARVAENVVMIETFDRTLIPRGQASGVSLGMDVGASAVLEGGCVITNYHAIHRAGLIVVTAKDGTKCSAWIVMFDRARDIALIRMCAPLNSPPMLPALEINVGDDVFAVGAPKGLGWTLSNGIVSALREDNGQRLVQTTAPISPGSSGGGLFNTAGQIVGITSSGVRDGQNLNFAIRATNEFVESLLNFSFLRQATPPEDVAEEYWNAGYMEADDITPRDPHSVPEWRLKSDPLRKWEALTDVIKGIEARLEKATAGMSKRAAINEKLARSRNASEGRPLGQIGDLEAELASAYASRLREFPDDIDAWHREYTLRENSMGIRERVLRIDNGLKRWPTDSRVFSHLLFALMACRDVPADIPSQLFRHIERVAEQIPSRKEFKRVTDELAHAQEAEVRALEANLRAITKDLYEPTQDAPEPFALPVSASRRLKVAERLKAKGWL